MADSYREANPGDLPPMRTERIGSRMSIPEIARRLAIGRLAVYTMLEQGLLPAIRVGRRWIVTRAAFEQWEKTCGTRMGPTGTGFPANVEVKVVN